MAESMLSRPTARDHRADRERLMAVIRTRLTGEDDVAAAEQPRDDRVVAEREVAAGVFTCDDGPFTTWERRVWRHDPAPGGPEEVSATQELRYSVAAPGWRPVIDLALRRVISRPPPARAWWTPPERLAARDSGVLARAAVLAVIVGFIGGLLTQTVTFAAKDFGEGTSSQSTALAIVRIGALVTLVALGIADRWGRRTMLRVSLAGAAISSFATAFVPGLGLLAATQLCSRGFVAAAALLIAVICAEEMPASARSFGIGVTALAGGLGVGMVLWVLPVVDLDPGAWRVLYLLAGPAGLIGLRVSAGLPETRRFDIGHLRHEPPPPYDPARLALVGLTFFFLNAFAGPMSQLQNDYLTNARGLSAAGVSVFLLATNTWGGLGVWAGARLADRVSRRFTALVGLVGFSVGNAAMFSFGGPAMWVASLAGSVIGAALVPSLGALQPELFPTRRRGASSGWTNLAAVAGSVAGFAATSWMIDDPNAAEYGRAMRLLAFAPLLAAALMFWIPETAGAELEELNPDDAVR